MSTRARPERPGTLRAGARLRRRGLDDNQLKALANVRVVDALLGGALAALPGGSGDSVEARAQAGVEEVADGLRRGSSARLGRALSGLTTIGAGMKAYVGATDSAGLEPVDLVFAVAAVAGGAVTLVKTGTVGDAQLQVAGAVDALSDLATLQKPYFHALDRARVVLGQPDATDDAIRDRARDVMPLGEAKYRCEGRYKTLVTRHARLLETEDAPTTRPVIGTAPDTRLVPRSVSTAMERPSRRSAGRGR